MATSPYALRLDDDLRKALEREAELEGRTVAQLATRAIRGMLGAKMAKRRAVDAALQEAAQGRFISEAAMNARIDSWDSETELGIPDVDLEPDRK
ncbi:MAG: hypothetical protein KDK26_05845 [Roseivivax sp.]|nr:hypothetical protein [Roseivivax sp.]